MGPGQLDRKPKQNQNNFVLYLENGEDKKKIRGREEKGHPSEFNCGRTS